MVKTAKELSIDLNEILKPIYFESLPLNQIANAVTKHGYNPTDLDGIYCGKEGRAFANIGMNRGIVIEWYRMESGLYEVNAYVS
jgi:hypothetical protein